MPDNRGAHDRAVSLGDDFDNPSQSSSVTARSKRQIRH
jgi:hypothetical protein